MPVEERQPKLEDVDQYHGQYGLEAFDVLVSSTDPGLVVVDMSTARMIGGIILANYGAASVDMRTYITMEQDAPATIAALAPAEKKWIHVSGRQLDGSLIDLAIAASDKETIEANKAIYSHSDQDKPVAKVAYHLTTAANAAQQVRVSGRFASD